MQSTKTETSNATNWNEEDLLRFKDQLPEEIREQLPLEIQRQFFLWDEIMKKEALLYPQLLFPLIEEIFHRTYPQGSKVSLLSTEYIVTRIENGKSLHSIYSDLVVQIGEKDIYHFECQMRPDKYMVIRMMEYDVHIALVHRTGGDSVEVALPKSAILYLTHTKNTPDVEEAKIHFPDGRNHLYQVPVLKVQNYSPQVIEEKGLFMLLPFLPIRYRPFIDEKTGKLENAQARKDLTKLLRNCMMILIRQLKDGTMEESQYKDFTDFLWKACKQLFYRDFELLKEAREIMMPVIKTFREEWEEEYQSALKTFREEWEKEHQKRIDEKDKEIEHSIQQAVAQFRKDGKTREESGRCLQDIFMLNEEEAKEKVKLYWQE